MNNHYLETNQKSKKLLYTIFILEIVQIEKNNLFQNLFVTQKYRNLIIFQHHAHLQSYTVIGE
jgi:hypothetical protein